MSTSSQLLSRRAFGRLAAGVAAGAGAGALSACSGGGGTPSAGAPLRIMAINHVWSQAVKRRTAEFEERIGRRVSMTLLTADQLASSYNVKLNASGTDVDVMMVRALQEQLLFGHNGWLADLSDRVADDARFAWDDFQDAPREASVTAGKVLSVPVVTERPALYYRKDLVEDLGGPPRTLEALMEGARELTRRKDGFYGYVGRGQRSGAVSQWSSFLYSYGGDFVVDGTSGIGSAEAVAAYEYYGRLLAGSGPPGATNMSLEQAMPIFAQGKAAFFVDADAIYSSFLDPKVSRVRETVGFAPFPAGPAGHRERLAAGLRLQLEQLHVRAGLLRRPDPDRAGHPVQLHLLREHGLGRSDGRRLPHHRARRSRRRPRPEVPGGRADVRRHQGLRAPLPRPPTPTCGKSAHT
ncbi:extracellular solute-binding protein [Streptomyces griseus]|uniref:ABC transporter substrate-binding protein n=1 Tax=Streptomyces griseus TaxID=1911 RepID=UPI0038669A3B|nr:extracellular solute-binding protein [Streptomyces fimicarius]